MAIIHGRQTSAGRRSARGEGGEASEKKSEHWRGHETEVILIDEWAGRALSELVEKV